IDQASGQSDPTNASPIHFTAVFSEPVSGFSGSDVSLSGSAGATAATVTDSGDHKTYDVAISGMTSDGPVVATIVAGASEDAAHNPTKASSSTDNTATYLTASPATTIDQAAAQNDPTNASSIHFTAVFGEPVTGFTAADVSLSGSA